MPEQEFASLYPPGGGGGGRLRNQLSRTNSRTQTNRKTRRKRESKTEKRGREECERPGGGGGYDKKIYETHTENSELRQRGSG